MALALGQQQQQLAQAATFEHLRERLEQGAGGAVADSPEKKMMRLAEEQQRLMQQALQQNLLAMASHFTPMNLKLGNGEFASTLTSVMAEHHSMLILEPTLHWNFCFSSVRKQTRSVAESLH